MAISDISIMVFVTGALIYFVLHEEHPFIEGFLYLLLGAGMWLVVADGNPFAYLVIAIGFIRIITAPYSATPERQS